MFAAKLASGAVVRPRMSSRFTGWRATALAIAVAMGAGTAWAQTTTPPLTAVEVGSKLFKDPRLSASGRMSCATCHAEAYGHADVPGTGLPKGGANLDLSGMRSSPTTRYLNENPPFYLDHNGDAFGGFTWDGRADSRKTQAKGPFFSPVEMALPGSPEDPSALTTLVRSADYFPALQALYPANATNTDAKLFRRVLELLELYQRDDPDYNRFDSKYDRYLAGTDALTATELRGLAIFNSPRLGNCASCHTSAGTRPLFTNFSFATLGVPRNHAGPLNADASFFDLGLCVRDKTHDPRVEGKARYCGQFKTPTLRNISRTAPYFHNGAIATLEEAVLFHFQRDTQPERWYRTAAGGVDRPYNDLPADYQRYLSKGRPFSGTWQPTAYDLSSLLAFLRTLDDADQTAPMSKR